tara:strand:+ start:142731 stop:144149 length:1419 start_codon:yes stop_codon:yes gene_type:complete
MKKSILIIPLMASTILAGCSLAPGYVQPQSDLPSAWALNLGEDAGVKASELYWENLFTAPKLQEVIKQALENNHDLRIAVLNIQEARAQYGIERANLLPTVNAMGSASRQKTPSAASGTGNSVSSSSYQANLATTAYELDLFGRVKSLNNAAFESWLSTVEAQKAVQTALIAQVANSYITWLANKDILDLTKETLLAQEQSYNLLKQSAEKGAASQLDVAQVKQALESAKVNLAIYTREVEQNKNALSLLVGDINLGNALDDAVTLKDILITQTVFNETPSEAILTRPDVMQAEHILKSYNANIGAARANFLPRISLTGMFGFASSDFSELFTGNAAGAWQFMPSVSLPIFNGGANFSNLTVSKTRKEKAVISYQKSIQTAFREVADELAARETLSLQLQAQEALVEASQKAYDLSFTRYKKGVDNFLNVLDAQRTLFAAQQGSIQLKKQKLANVFNLYKALGGGVKNTQKP